MEKSFTSTPRVDLKLLGHVLSNTKLEQVFENIRREITSTNGENVVALFRAMYVGSPPTDEKNTERRFDIFKFCIHLLQATDLPSEVATELLSLLLIEVEPFPTSSLIKVADHLVEEFKKSEKPEGKWLEIIPRVLSILSFRDTIVYQGLDTSGADLKKLMVESLCDDDDMSQASIMMLTTILKDVTLTKKEIEVVVDKLLCVLPNVSYQEMPTFMYQFLLFSSKGQRKKILQSIIAYFISEDYKRRTAQNDADNASENVIELPDTLVSRQTEGTVVLLLKVSARQDRGLGKDLVSMLKSLQYNPMISLSPFMFSIALSLACVQRYEDEVLDILKGMILRAFKQKEKGHHSVWIRDILAIKQDVIPFVKEAINNSKHGWDHVGQGLVKFGFLLLDSFGPKLVCGRVPSKCKPHNQTISEQICALGCVILRDTFKAHRTVRSEIFEQILSRVITKSTSPVSHYIDVLYQTVQSDPQLLLEILSKLMEVLDYLPFVPYENAVKILKALTPLLKISMPLKDALMLILRKALFHRDLEARKIAITGYITILKRISAVGKLALSQSQSTMSSQSSSCSMSSQLLGDCSFNATTKSESMCLEIMGILKRILMQQAEVKQVLYEGLYDAVVKNSSLADIILELLLSQFEKFYNSADKNDFPLDVFSCITVDKEKGKIILEEPLAHLISAICLILYEVQGEINGIDDNMDLDCEQNAQVMLECTLKTLIEKMLKLNTEQAELEELDDATDAQSTEKYKELVSLLLNTYEALMEYSFLRNKTHSLEEYENLLGLFQKYQTLSEKLQNKKSTKSSKNKQTFYRPPASQLTIRFFSVIIETLFSDDSENVGVNILQSSNDFVNYILQSCHSKLVAYSETGRSDNFSLHMERTNDYICTIAKMYLRLYTVGLNSSFRSFQTWELSSFFIKGLSVIFSYMFSSNERQSSKLLSELGKSIPSASDDAATRVLKKFQKLTIKALSDPEDDEKLKEVAPLFSIITDVCTVQTNLVNEDVYQWVKQLSIEQTFDDVPLVKKLLSLCLTLSHQQQNCTHLLKDISSDIHHHLGDVDSNASVSNRTHYNIVSAKSSPEVISLVVQHIEQILEEIDWVLNIMKADAQLLNTAIQESLPNCSDDFNVKEGNVCGLLLDLMKVYNELEQTEIPIGTYSNSVLKVTTSIYKCLTMVCKYYLSRLEQQTGYLHPMFTKVVKYSGTELTPPVYGFITYIQTKEIETTNNKKKPKADTAPKFVREVKTIPALVFAIELYERHLIMLSRKTKKNLMSHIKLSTARDFRIDPSAIEAMKNQYEEESANNTSVAEATTHDADDNGNSSGDEATPIPDTPQPKKKRKNESVSSTRDA